MIETLLQDIKYAVALLIRKPGFSVVAILGLTLGIGANTAIFSVVNALLVRPLPYRDPGKLVKVWSHNTIDPTAPKEISYPNFTDWRDQNDVFEGIAAYVQGDSNFTGRGEPERLHAVQTSYNLFSLLGVTPVAGRAFLPQEDRPGATPVALISHGLWQRYFGENRSVIGSTITLDGADTQIVGVLPQGFNFVPGTDVWTPLAMKYDPNQRLSLSFEAVARLKPNVSIGKAQSEMGAIAARLAQLYPATNKNWSVNLVPLQRDIVGKFRTPLLVLLGAVFLVLLISCANAANLLLAHAGSRHKEICIRLAIGAGRFRIVRQLLTESVILGLAGGGLGLILAIAGVKALTKFATNVPLIDRVGVDLRVLGFTIGLSILTGLIFGLAPALQASKTDLTDSLKESARGASAGRFSKWLRNVLVVSEIAFALMLLIGAGLLLKSFSRLQSVGLGFNPQGVVTFDVQLPFEKYNNKDKRANFFRQTLDRLRSIPGVKAAAATLTVPLSGNNALLLFYAEGRPARGPEDYTAANFNSVSPGFFSTMQTPIIRGRDITDQDKADSTPVVVISDSMARKFFPGQDPIGKRIKLGTRPDSPQPWITVVGIAADTKENSIEDRQGETTMYFPCLQRPQVFSSFVVRVDGDRSTLASEFRGAVQGVDKDQPIASVKTMDQILLEYNSQRRLVMLLIEILAGLALLLASIGVYGVMAYSVNQRTHEIGIRLALGARRPAVLAMIVRQSLWLALGGAVGGLALAYSLTRLMVSLLFNVSSTDPVCLQRSVTVTGRGGGSCLACARASRNASRSNGDAAL